jgi:hypothetical protein
MPIDFPDSPSLNDTFTVDSRTWEWTGVAWKIATASLGPTGPTGPAGTDGADGVIGVDGEPGKFIVSGTAPADPEEGDAWFNSTNSRLYMYYDSYWVEASAPVAGPTGPTGSAGPTGPQGVFQVSDTMPTSAVLGDAWFDSSTSRTYVYFGDTWVEVIGAAGPAGTNGTDGADGGFDSTQTIQDIGSSVFYLEDDGAGKLFTNNFTFTGVTVYVSAINSLGVGKQADFLQTGSDQITFEADAGITLYSKDGNLKTAAQYSPASIKCIATNTYVLIGDLGA